ncbi:MAG: class I SAM-dependent methyltransferase, partial [Deltaproteobacteria bacterium]|nr:class I SAM-dependent methyltransferase [Deltaproteobacteria bacterium]
MSPATPGPADDRSATAHYDDPVYYDRAYADRSADVAYYVALARARGGPILEYGVGTGRVALPLARAGFDVVGVDRSGPMLARLRERLALEPRDVAARVRVRSGDFRSLSLSRRFPLVIAPFNALLHLHELDDFER